MSSQEQEFRQEQESRSPETARHFRAEARPFPPDQLIGGQRDAYVEIVRWLVAAVEASSQTTARSHRVPDFEFLDPTRQNQVFFLTGSRGSGKSSVLMSIMDTLDLPVAAGRTTSAQGGTMAVAETALLTIAQHIVWLEPLDLEPLPHPTNLLAAILARVQRAVQRRSPATSGQQSCECPSSPSRPFQHQHHAREMRELRQLMVDVARAWDGNLAERAASIDPDGFATETVEAEHARLSLNRRFSSALAGAGRLVAPGPDRPALFVLFVDDFDLNPPQVMPVLRLLRTISVRPLLTVIAGDLRMAERVAYLTVSGQFRRLSAGIPYPGARRDFSSAPLEARMLAVAGDVAANAIRKLLPPGQRLDLPPLPQPAALEYRPTQAHPTLRDMLLAVPLRPDTEPIDPGGVSNILEIFKDVTALGGDSKSLPYPGSLFFCAPLRHIVDMWQHVHGRLLPPPVDVAERNARLVDWAAHLLLDALSEDPQLPSTVREQLLAAVQRHPLTAAWELNTAPFSLHGDVGSTIKLVPRVADYHPWNPPEVTFRKILGWVVRPDAASVERATTVTEAEPPLWKLDHRATGSLALFHDLLVMTDRGSVEPEWRDREMDQRSYATWQTSGRPLHISWFSSVWDTLWSLTQFARVWNGGQELVSRRQEVLHQWEEIVVMAYYWIAGGVAALGVDPGDLVRTDINFKHGGLRALPWESLRASILRIVLGFAAAKDMPHSRRYRVTHAWLVNVALLLAPEAAVPAEIWNDDLLGLNLLRGATWGNQGLDASERREVKERYEASGEAPAEVLAHILGQVWCEDGMARSIRTARAERMRRGGLTRRGLSLLAPDVAKEAGFETEADRFPLNRLLYHPEVSFSGRSAVRWLCPGERSILRATTDLVGDLSGEEQEIAELLRKRIAEQAASRSASSDGGGD